MDCKTARRVWNNPEGVIAGIQECLPEVYEYLREQASRFVEGVPSAYSTLIHQKAGNGNYRVEHSNGESPLARATHDVLGDLAACRELGNHFSLIFDREIRFGNLCCGGCITSGDLDEMHILRIQMATVNTDPLQG